MVSGRLNPRSHFVSSQGTPAFSQKPLLLVPPSTKPSQAVLPSAPHLLLGAPLPCSHDLAVWSGNTEVLRSQKVRVVHPGGKTGPNYSSNFYSLSLPPSSLLHSECIPLKPSLPPCYLPIYSQQSLLRDIISCTLHINSLCYYVQFTDVKNTENENRKVKQIGNTKC